MENKLLRRVGLFFLLIWLAFGLVGSVSAHANLLRAEPSASAILSEAPGEIRLTFSESLEPDFSSIELRDAQGQVIQTPPAFVASDDGLQLALEPGDLPDGVYTVAWRVVSQTDGHLTQGSFPIIIGDASQLRYVEQKITEPIPPDSALVRWANMLSLALGIGGAGFCLFARGPQHRSFQLMWLGWIGLGLTTILILLLQVSIAAGAISISALDSVVTETRFGRLWVARLILWIVLGASLTRARSQRQFLWISFLAGAGILLTQSLFSHASSVQQDRAAAILSDWLHLIAMSLWLGGLFHMAALMPSLRGTESLARLVAQFSNLARVAVAALIITGAYAAWLNVGSVDALLNTRYGTALLVKLILFIPLLAIAGVNLIFTQRGLRAGQPAWRGRLRGLIAAEIILLAGVLAAVGVMTAIAPARNIIAQREALPEPPQTVPYAESGVSEGLNVALEISSTWIGKNDFTLRLTDTDGNPVEDASRIRLRFTNLDEDLGESELNPTHAQAGTYTASGAQLSVPGEWRIRVTVQRPGAYDSVVDFHPQIELPPLPPPAGEIETVLPERARALVLILGGLVALAAGGFFVATTSGENPLGARFVSVGLAGAGIVFLASGLLAASRIETRTTAAAADVPPDAPISIAPDRDSDLPFIITGDGHLLEPGEDGVWQSSTIEAHVNDVYMDSSGYLWAATDDGLYVHPEDKWIRLNDAPVQRLFETHGYLYAMGAGLTRLPSGDITSEDGRQLNKPLNQQRANDLVMLGNHTHVLQNGGAVFQSGDLGLTWQPLDAPEAISLIGNDVDGNLLAVSADGVWVWSYSIESWRKYMPLPDGNIITQMNIFQGQLYAVAGGRLYRQRGTAWQQVDLPESSGGYVSAVAQKFPHDLWALDAARSRLWHSTDGETWAIVRIEIQVQ